MRFKTAEGEDLDGTVLPTLRRTDEVEEEEENVRLKQNARGHVLTHVRTFTLLALAESDRSSTVLIPGFETTKGVPL